MINYFEQRFVYFTECQLATLEGIQNRKGSSKSELRRQQSITDGMVSGLSEHDLRGSPRVLDKFNSYPSLIAPF